jgi:hypothetical protein
MRISLASHHPTRRGSACIERCVELGYTRYNAMLGESHALVHQGWLAANEIAAWLRALPHSANSGDITPGCPSYSARRRGGAVHCGGTPARWRRSTKSDEDHLILLNALPKLSFTGSIESVATFWAMAGWAVESSTISESDFTVTSWLAKSKADLVFARAT